jgi:hypothetical protein
MRHVQTVDTSQSLGLTRGSGFYPRQKEELPRSAFSHVTLTSSECYSPMTPKQFYTLYHPVQHLGY